MEVEVVRHGILGPTDLPLSAQITSLRHVLQRRVRWFFLFGIHDSQILIRAFMLLRLIFFARLNLDLVDDVCVGYRSHF